jgi:hypothetical protein
VGYEADRQETGRWLKTDYTLGIVKMAEQILDFVEYRWSQSLIAPIRVLLDTFLHKPGYREIQWPESEGKDGKKRRAWLGNRLLTLHVHR